MPAPVVPSMPVVAGGFACILADPPWKFAAYSDERSGTPHRTDDDHYPTMPVGDIAELPVAGIAARDCALFMWVVGCHLADAVALADAWGFSYKTDAFYWIKQKLIDADQVDMFTGDIAEPVMGMGYWTRKQAEICLLFTRGKPKPLAKNVRQLIIEPRREHSRKPDCQYERIEALVAGPRIELFARTDRPGWESWGQDQGKFGVALSPPAPGGLPFRQADAA